MAGDSVSLSLLGGEGAKGATDSPLQGGGEEAKEWSDWEGPELPEVAAEPNGQDR